MVRREGGQRERENVRESKSELRGIDLKLRGGGCATQGKQTRE